MSIMGMNLYIQQLVHTTKETLKPHITVPLREETTGEFPLAGGQ